MANDFIHKINKTTQYIISITLVSCVAVIGYLFTDIVGYRVIAFILLVTVSLLAMFLDIVPVLFAAILSALIWDYYFIPPRFTMHVSSTEDVLMLLMYFVIALVNAVLTFKIRQFEKAAIQKDEKEKVITLYNTLLNSLSHELRTPIATIIGATDNLLSNTGKLNEFDKHELVHEISSASLRLNQQVDNLLNMSRLESGVIEPKRDWCDINELVYSAVNKLEGNLHEHIIKINIPETFPLFKLDFALMEQVLYNILFNASLYTPPGSTITIHAKTFDYITQDKWGMDVVSNKLVITIKDNGKGFPSNEIEKVFDKFYRLKNSKTGGTGLGLSIVKGFVEAHKGTVELLNIAEGGAAFIISIPAETTYINALKNE